MRWNNRRRTISKLSSDDAGRHDDSIRPIADRRRRSASRPPEPPISASEPMGVPSGDSEAGIDTTSSAPGVARTVSVSDCAKEKWVSNVPPRRLSSV